MISQYFVNADTSPNPNKFGCPFAFGSSRFLSHRGGIVVNAAEITLGKNLNYLNRYNTTRMCLAVIAAGSPGVCRRIRVATSGGESKTVWMRLDILPIRSSDRKSVV